MQIDLSKYQETCHHCEQAARTELVADDRIGIEWFQFCINPKCIQYDQNITRERERAEQAVRESAVGRREHEKLWKLEIRRMQRARRKQRQSIGRALAA